MVDKVRPLKIEDSGSGTEINFVPTEVDPLEDHISTKGISFEGLDTFLLQKLGRTIVPLQPNGTLAVTYTAAGEVSVVEYFNSASQITANRIARVDMSYSGVDPSSEAWKIYDTNGTTVLRTYTVTYTYTGVEISSASVAVT